jgi:hypothetical protein
LIATLTRLEGRGSYLKAPLEAQATSRAIECENIFGRYFQFDGFLGARFDILKLRWLPTNKHLTMAEPTEALQLDDDDKAVGRRLRDIRKKAADGELGVSPTDAVRYRDLVVTLLRSLRDRDIR